MKNTTTCIVGLIDKGKVYIGGDSAGVSGLDTVVRAAPKVFEKKAGREKMLIGYTSSFRMGQLLRFNLKVPAAPKNMDTYEYMVTKFVDAIRKCFKKGGYMKTRESVESGGAFLVAFRKRLFLIADDYQVGENLYPYNSCGCGERYALGSLHATQNVPLQFQPSALHRVNLALKAAEEFSGGVRSPFRILTLED